MTNLKRLLVAMIASGLTFVLVFLGIFIPMLFWDEHVAPFDGQGGMSGFFLGLGVAATLAWLVAPATYVLGLRRRWFEKP